MTADRAVVALGNPYRGDDGVGQALLERLGDRDLPATDRLDLGNGGFDLVHVVTEYDAIVLVDAVEFGGEPGDVTVFDPTDVDANAERGTHETDAFELLELGDGLASTKTTIRIVAIQPSETGFGEGLSPAVAETLPAATDRLIDTVGEL